MSVSVSGVQGPGVADLSLNETETNVVARNRTWLLTRAASLYPRLSMTRV